jgi:hypothetical protein
MISIRKGIRNGSILELLIHRKMLKLRLISLILENQIHYLTMVFYLVFGHCNNRKEVKKDGFVEEET